MEIEVVEKMEILNIIHKIVDKTWNVIKNGIQSLLSLFQKRELPAIEPAELPPDESIIPVYTIRGRSGTGWKYYNPVISGVEELVTGRLVILEESESDEPDEPEESESDEPIILEESESDLRGFDRQYTIRYGRGRYDPVLFVDGVSELITNRLEITRETKVMLALRCYMQRTNTATGEETIVMVPFWSGVKKILDTSDVYDIYNKMIDRIEEYLVGYSALSSIAGLEIHTRIEERL